MEPDLEVRMLDASRRLSLDGDSMSSSSSSSVAGSRPGTPSAGSRPGTPCAGSRPGTPPPGEATLTLQQGWLDKIKQLWESVRMTIFVLGTALITVAAARNTITWQLQRFWGASGDYWQLMWNTIYWWFGGNEMALALWGTLIFSNVVFWLANALFLVLDYTGRPAFLLKYKIQEEKNIPVDPKKLRKAVLQILFNQSVVGIPFFYGIYHLMVFRGCQFGLTIPTFHWALFEITIYVLVEEVMFYYSHRMLHHPRLYKYVHKQHHEWTAPIGIIGLYAHPVEHILSNLLPPVMGPLLMGSHIGTAWLWFGLALTSTSISHSGYHFPFLPSPEAHDYHHLKFNNCFGVMGVLDYLHGTDRQFRASKQYQRHFMTLNLTPIKELIPEDTPKNRPRTKSE